MKHKIRMNLEYKTMNDSKVVKSFIKKIGKLIKKGRIYNHYDIDIIKLDKWMIQNKIFRGGGASDYHTFVCSLLERCLKKILGKEIPRDYIL